MVHNGMSGVHHSVHFATAKMFQLSFGPLFTFLNRSLSLSLAFRVCTSVCLSLFPLIHFHFQVFTTNQPLKTPLANHKGIKSQIHFKNVF